MASLEQRLVRAGIEPGVSAPQSDHAELAGLEVAAVHVGDFQLPPGRRLERLRDAHDLAVVEVQAGYRKPRLRPRRLLLDAHCAAVSAELYDAVAFRVLHLIREDRGAR